jgi:hypothetical protein
MNSHETDISIKSPVIKKYLQHYNYVPRRDNFKLQRKSIVAKSTYVLLLYTNRHQALVLKKMLSKFTFTFVFLSHEHSSLHSVLSVHKSHGVIQHRGYELVSRIGRCGTVPHVKDWSIIHLIMQYTFPYIESASDYIRLLVNHSTACFAN